MISIIVTAYNIEKYIDTCISSLVNQTEKNIEIICVDDGSTDKTSEKLQRWAERDSRIKYVTHKNKGVGYSRNRGLELANGEYICFIDGDDFVDTTLCEKALKIATKSRSDIVVYDVASFDNGTRLIDNSAFLSTEAWLNHTGPLSSHTYKDNPEFYHSNYSAANKLYRRKFLQDNNLKFVENLRFEDCLFHFQSFILAKRINLLAQKLYYYRKNRPNSMMTTLLSKTEVAMDIFEIGNLAEQFLQEKNLFSTVKYDLYRFKLIMYNNNFVSANLKIKKKFYDRAKKDIQTFQLKNISQLDKCKVYYNNFMRYNFFICLCLLPLCELKNKNIANKVQYIKSVIEESFDDEVI